MPGAQPGGGDAEATFVPQINPDAKQRRARSVDEMSRGDAQRRARNVEERRKSLEDAVRIMVAQVPKVVQSLLDLRSEKLF